MAHQVFVSITQDVVALGAVTAKIQTRRVEDADQVGQAVDHLLALAELLLVVEIGHVDDASEVISLG
ncbi:hypothetical protein D3C76_1543090 [compost metagenome]